MSGDYSFMETLAFMLGNLRGMIRELFRRKP